MAIKDYSTEPDMNTTISGINIAEGCAPSGINNAIRQLMADVKAEKDTRDSAQTAKDAEQDEAISSKVSTVNGLTPDSNGNVDVGGMPLGTVFPYTGKDVPAGTLRADGATYTNMRTAFPDFYEWVKNSGLTVDLGNYALVEGSCGYYGLDETTGTVRMPTITNGFVGAAVAGQYGQAVQAGLPNILGAFLDRGMEGSFATGLFNDQTFPNTGRLTHVAAVAGDAFGLNFDASRFNPIYGRSDTVTPSHVKYPWVIVVYNAAVPPSVAEAAEFIGLLDGKADKTELDNKADKSDLEGVVRSVNGIGAGAGGNVQLGSSAHTAPDFSVKVSLAANTVHTMSSNGFIYIEFLMYWGEVKDSWFALNNGSITVRQRDYSYTNLMVPVKKGDAFKFTPDTNVQNAAIYFCPAR